MIHDPLDLSGQAEQDETQKERQRLESEQATDDLKAVMDSPPGRRFVWRLLEQAGVYRASYAGEATHATAFNEGRRNQGLQLLSEIFRACPGSYTLMVQEAHERTQRSEFDSNRSASD
jgi:hypothetical protein